MNTEADLTLIASADVSQQGNDPLPLLFQEEVKKLQTAFQAEEHRDYRGRISDWTRAPSGASVNCWTGKIINAWMDPMPTETPINGPVAAF
ncbi:MAG: hypothetical protein CL912_26465 [Deltaproteobacteria bacterium]|nr:hypothetical protein [Deltaproteobacteria bacterium]|tara:strand:+ start:158 stop:430 length:273 start_codon:yes stop_codon:yes gene_type:complete